MSGTILSIRNDNYNLDYIKKAFHLFMTLSNPQLKPKTLATYCSDAFYIYDQLPERWVANIITDKEHSDVELQNKLQVYIRNDITGARVCPDKDARSYTKHFWQLITFLRMLYIIEEGRLATPRRIGE